MARKIGSVEAKRMGLRLRDARKAAGLTLIEVGLQSEMHYTQVSKIERGKFGFINQNVQKLCKIVKIDPDVPDGSSPEELHARLDRLIRDNPEAAVALRAVFEAFDRMTN